MIIPSILAKTKKEFLEKLKKVSFAKRVQIDVAEPFFVDNLTAGIKEIKSVKNFKHPALEIHLMLSHPEISIDNYLELKPRAVIIHAEIKHDIEILLAKIRKKAEAGIAVNPETPISSLKKYKGAFDFITIMSVHPGFYGAKFVPKSIERIKQAKKLFPKTIIEMDGSMNEETIKLCKKAGAKRFVVGSKLFNSKDIKKEYAKLQRV